MNKSPDPASRSLRTLSVDIGGSGIKVLVLDDAGKPLTKRPRVKTPEPSTPAAVIETIAALAAAQGDFDRVSIGLPGLVRDGVTETADNLDSEWVGFRLSKAVSERLGKPVRAANDADVQGLGAISGRGVELVLTLGTGMGSALFVEGVLVPNLELVHHPFRKGKTYEEHLGRAGLKKQGKKKWNRLLAKAIKELDRLFNFDRLYLGGGNAKKITPKRPPTATIVPNVAGLLGGISLWQDSTGHRSKN
ncbi:MAG: ROK family protein [Acidobacteria bacterium]|nr:ROK family protein [Acidobacteriota bacterium]